MLVQETSRKDEIVNHAAHLFRIKGYSATSMRDLATAVGMEAASLYNHMSGKQQLLEIICREVAKRHADNLKKLDDISGTAMARIEWLLREHIRVNVGIPEMAAVADDEWTHLDEPYKEHFSLLRNAYEEKFKSLLRDAKTERSIKEIDIEVLLYTLLSSVQWLHHWYRRKRSISASELEEDMIEIILGGIKN